MSRHSVSRLCRMIALPRAGAFCPHAESRIPSSPGGAPEVPRLAAANEWAALAHDLRSCLNAILLSTEAARLGTRPGRQIDLGLLLSQVERNTRTVLDLIESSQVKPRAASPERRLSIAAVRLDEVARETTDAMQPIAGNAGIHVSLHADAAVSVQGDRIRLGRVISNLLANGIRHSPKGSSIDVVVTTHRSTALCHVADRGPGVPAGDRERIFGRHFQGGGRPGAAGLGLFICREIVKEHGGRIWVEDHLPRGARFVFTIPLERSAPKLQRSQSTPKSSDEKLLEVQ